jgi:6-oxo-cyclohex-1-ene-carbonyl-CoA hydrolase
LHLYVGIEKAMYSLTLCEQWTAHQAYMNGMITDIVPALKVNGEFVANPMINLTWTDARGRMSYGTVKSGAALQEAKAIIAQGVMDLSILDNSVNTLIAKLLMTFPNCMMKTISAVRQKKLQWWDCNREANREWLALNMMTEARAGFMAFNDGPKDNREVDFVKLRQLLAQGHEWNEDLRLEISPRVEQQVEAV